MFCILDLILGNFNPDIFKNIGDLSEHRIDALEPVREKIMDPILRRTAISEVEDPDVVIHLTDALDPAFSLFKSCRVPGKVEINKSPGALEIEPLACGIGADEKADLAMIVFMPLFRVPAETDPAGDAGGCAFPLYFSMSLLQINDAEIQPYSFAKSFTDVYESMFSVYGNNPM